MSFYTLFGSSLYCPRLVSFPSPIDNKVFADQQEDLGVSLKHGEPWHPPICQNLPHHRIVWDELAGDFVLIEARGGLLLHLLETMPGQYGHRLVSCILSLSNSS